MASGYITVEAIRNGIYMKALTDKENIELCMLDLAKGYQRKNGKYRHEFVYKCVDEILKHSPNNINALLLKGETLKLEFDQNMEAMGYEEQVNI